MKRTYLILTIDHPKNLDPGEWPWYEAVPALEGDEEVTVQVAEDPDDELVFPFQKIEREETEARIRELEETLTWISDPSYTGNYDVYESVRIHRKWAKAALSRATKRVP